MAKKKITAPLSYDPGKGRPKEHLAYLNYQEMQALKRLNGNNMERGPKGLPSFPPADATGGSYNSGYGSAASRPSSSVSRISGGTAGSNAARAASSGSGFSNLGGGGRDSGQAAARQTTASRFADSTKSTPQGVFGPRAGTGTNYLRTTNAPGMITTGVSGFPSVPRGNAEATLRAYEESKRTPFSTPKQILDRVPQSVRFDRKVPLPNSGLSYNYNNALPSGMYPGSYMYNPTAKTRQIPQGVKAPVNASSNPPIYTPGKALKEFRDPIADRVIQSIVPGSPIGSLVSNLPNRTVAFMSPEDIGLPPDIGPSLDRTRGIPALDGIIAGRPLPGAEIDPASMEIELDVQNLFSDAGIRKPTTPSPPVRLAGPRSFLNIYHEGLPPGYAERYGFTEKTVGEPAALPPGVRMRDEISDFPRNISDEAEAEMDRQNKANAAGINVIKRNPLAKLGDAVRKLVTGENTAEAGAELKRQYLQSSPEQQAELERAYPNLIKFASDVGATPQSPMKNYYDWADRAGLRAPPSREGGNENSGIEAIAPRPPRDGEPSPRPDTSSGSRPDIYYMWDLGIKIPSPSDPNYTQYQAYLAERLAAQ